MNNDHLDHSVKPASFLKLKWVLTAALIISVLPYFLISYFVVPAADDFIYGSTSIQSGWWESQVHYYRNWTGRYISTFVQTTAPLIGNYVETYKLYAFSLLLLTAFSFWNFFSALMARKLCYGKAILPALLFMSVYINLIPTVLEGFYWLSAAYTYQLGHVLVFFTFSILLIRPPQRTRYRTMQIGAIIVLSAMTVGCGEVISFIFISFLLVGAIVNLKLKRMYARNCFFLALTVACAFFSLVYSAPGNSIRSQHFPNQHQMALSLELTWSHGFFFLKQWVLSPILWFSVLFAVPFAKKTAHAWQIEKVKTRYILAASGYLCILFFLSFFLPFWATGLKLYSARTVNTNFLVFLTGLLILLILLASRISNKRLSFRKSSAAPVCATLLLISLLQTGNFPIVFSDLKIAPHFKKQCEYRFQVMAEEKAKGNQDLALPSINVPYYPSTISYYDITVDPNDEMNKTFAAFFRLKSVRLVIPPDAMNQMIQKP